MRVSDHQRYSTFTRDIQQRLVNLTRIQQELGTGKRIFAPSENVVDAGTALRTTSTLSESAQYQRNIDDGLGFVQSADGNLQSIIDLINEIDSLAVSADNDANNEDDRRNIATQLNTKLEQVVNLMNARHGDDHLFGGWGTTSPPFNAVRNAQDQITGVSAAETSIGGEIYRRIGAGEDVRINLPGDLLFQPIGEENTTDDLVYVVAQLRDTIGNNNQPPSADPALSNEQLRTNLDAIRERIINQQAYLGAVGDRMEKRKSALKEIDIQLTDRLEQAAGVDMADLASRLAVEEGVYNALLTINSKVLSRGLVDYLT